MSLIAIAAFWISLALALYVYLGYPLLIAMLSHFCSRPELSDSHQPLVTLIIPARNEEQWIRHKIENTLALDYPRSLLRVLWLRTALRIARSRLRASSRLKASKWPRFPNAAVSKRC